MNWPWWVYWLTGFIMGGLLDKATVSAAAEQEESE